MRKWLSLIMLSGGVAAASGAGLAACSADDIDAVLNCADVCNAYIDCEDVEGFDRGNCADRCEDVVEDLPGGNTDPLFENCEDCVDSNACEEHPTIEDDNVWQCESQCMEILKRSGAPAYNPPTPDASPADAAPADAASADAST